MKKYLILILIVLLLGCKTQLPKSYYDTMAEFSFEMKDHFPQKKIKAYEGYYDKFIELAVYYKYDGKVNSNLKYIYKSNYKDSLFVVFSKKDHELEIDKINFYVIPNFNDLYFFRNMDKNLPEDDITFYVIDMKPLNYKFKDRFKDFDFFPVNWQHGYSKGIAVSETLDRIAYWVVVW